MKKLGVLIHGAGWVSTQHINAFKNNPATEIVALSSRTKASAERRACEAGLEVPCLDDYEQALAIPGVDIVSICTPQHVHAEHAIAAARAGKHLVIEKPVATNPTDMCAMRDAIEAAGVKTVVSFVLRWNPLVERLKSMIGSDYFGEIYYVETDYQSYCGDWWSGYPEGRTKAEGVSSSLQAGCHAVDALRWFAGQGTGAADPVEVFAYRGGKRGGSNEMYNPLSNTFGTGDPLEIPGLELLLVKFSNGVLGKVSTNFECIQPYAFPIEIFGNRGTAKGNRIWSHKYPEQKDWVELDEIRPDSSDVSHHPFQGEMDHFVDCILNDRESHCNFADAMKTHEIIFGALESFETGMPVQLPLKA